MIITGASGGLGKEIALQLAKKNAHLVLIARNKEKLEQVAAECQQLGADSVDVYSCDLADRQERESLYKQLEMLPTIDVLINNAGYGLFEEAVKFNQNTIVDMFELNVFALMELSILATKKMKQQQHGHIIQIASQAGKMATEKSSVYSATKFSVLGFSNALRLELQKDGVYVTCVNPGPIATQFFERADATGQYLKAVGNFTLDAQTVAKKIVNSIGTNKREINLPKLMNIGAIFYTLFPKVGDYVASRLFNKK